MMGIFVRFAPFLLGAGLLTVFVHILTILVLPAVATRTAGHRLQALASGPGVHIVPPPTPAEAATPFADPAMATAICAFDLADGPFRVRAQTGENFGSLVVLSSAGVVLHGLTDKAATRRVLDVLVGTDQQMRQIEAQDSEDRPAQEIRLRIGPTKGLIVLHALVARPSDRAAVTDLLRRTQCATAVET